MSIFQSFVGIDYSITGPACCVFDGGEYHFLAFQGVKKVVDKFSVDKYHFDIRLSETDYKNNIERYAKTSKAFLDFIEDKSRGRVVTGFEGYALNATGKTFNIAEATQTLKIRLYNSKNVDFHLDSPSPGSVKITATGKGNSGKHAMVDAFTSKTGINLLTHIPKNYKSDSPISDIADAFWVMETLRKIYD